MTSIFGKWLKYVANRLNYVINGLKMWKMTQRLGKWRIYLETWEMAKIFGKWLRYMGHLLSICEAVLLCWICLKNLTNGLNLCEMTHIFGKWHKYLRNG